uniref:Putative secreted protein n=1 Tax=Ixodes ricinus TaxID=34613 RepID=A0A6B0UWI5_IXORI
MPCGAASHLLLSHVHGLAAARADVRASPARLLLRHRLHSAVLRCHVRLRRRRDVAGRRPILVSVTRIHGEHARPSAVAVALGAEQLSVARAAEDVTVMFRQVAAVQTAVAVRICTRKALDMPVLPDGDLLLVEEHRRVAPWTDPGHAEDGLEW